MKIFTLGLLATTLLISCGDEVSQNNTNEDIYRKRQDRKLNLETPISNGENANQVVTQQVPFDLGLSAVLGAGALAAIRTARKRRLAEK